LSPPRFRVRSKSSVSLFIACALLACSDGGGGSSLAALGIDDGASAGLSKSANASPEKSVRIALETGALVEIPAGAVTKDVKVSMERPEDGKALDLVNRLPKAADRIASAPYVLTPHGTKFQSDVTIKLPLSKKDATAVSVAWLEDEDDSDWKVLANAQIEAGKAAVKLKHFSVLLLIEDARDLPRLDAGSESRDQDAGAEVRDATLPDQGEDAEIGVELDASSDEPDARAALDAGDDPLDAATRTDAQQPPDASAGGDAALPASSLLTKLTQCGLVTQQGSLPEPELSDPTSRCHYRCCWPGPAATCRVFTASTETQRTPPRRWPVSAPAGPRSSCAPTRARAITSATASSNAPTAKTRLPATRPTSSVPAAAACQVTCAAMECSTVRRARTSRVARGTSATRSKHCRPTTCAMATPTASTERTSPRAAPS
jgi:hypothetical protein